MLSKIMGTNNKLNNALATVNALASFKQGKNPKKKETVKDVVDEEVEETAVAEAAVE